jgi:hypothetical protein
MVGPPFEGELHLEAMKSKVRDDEPRAMVRALFSKFPYNLGEGYYPHQELRLAIPRWSWSEFLTLAVPKKTLARASDAQQTKEMANAPRPREEQALARSVDRLGAWPIVCRHSRVAPMGDVAMVAIAKMWVARTER